MNTWYDDLRGSALIDDESIDALLRGAPVPAELAAVAGAVDVIRSAGMRHVQPSPELAERIVTGDFADVDPYEPPPLPPGTHRRQPRFTLRAKIAAAVFAGVSGLTVATAADALPGDIAADIKDAARKAVEFLIPFDEAPDSPGEQAEDKAPEIPAEIGPGIDREQLPATPTPTPTPTPSPTPTPTPTNGVVGIAPAEQTVDSTDADRESDTDSDTTTTDPTDSTAEPSPSPSPSPEDSPGSTPTTPGVETPPALDGGAPPGLRKRGPLGPGPAAPPGLSDGLPSGAAGQVNRP